MSTEYYTEPAIPYQDLIETMAVQEPPKIIYSVPHKLLEMSGSFIYVRDDGGKARFERFGINNVDNIFPVVIEKFNVKVFDEFGVEYN